MTTTHIRVSAAEAATDATNLETFQAGEWCAVERVTLAGTTAAVRYVGGGSSTAPAHFFVFRRTCDGE